jgi:predicted transcriptional regulator
VNPLLDQFADSIENGKIQLEQFAWGEHGLERTFRDALEIMDLFTNETRVRMLMPLLERPYGKRHFRSEINPKLVYENLSSLLQHKLIGETEDDLYNLTPVGNRLLCEYLAFVERVRHMLGEDAD